MFLKLQEEEIPSFALHFSFQSNMAFMVAVFVLSSALGWALRDHRRRLLEIATEEQEDRLYLTILGILFCVCTMGSYYAFNRTSDNVTSGPSISRNILIDEIYRTLLEAHKYWNREKVTTNVPYSPDYPVKMPIPKRNLLDEAMHQQHEPNQEYRSLTSLILFFVLVFAVWYFYPRGRPDIAPPKDYMDETAFEDNKQQQAQQPAMSGSGGSGSASKKTASSKKPGSAVGATSKTSKTTSNYKNKPFSTIRR